MKVERNGVDTIYRLTGKMWF